MNWKQVIGVLAIVLLLGLAGTVPSFGYTVNIDDTPLSEGLSTQEMEAIKGGHAYIWGYTYYQCCTRWGYVSVNMNGNSNYYYTQSDSTGYYYKLVNPDYYRVQGNKYGTYWSQICYADIQHTNVRCDLYLY